MILVTITNCWFSACAESIETDISLATVLSIWSIGDKKRYLIISNQIWFWSSTLTEIGIAATLSWRLWKYKDSTGDADERIAARVDSKVNRIVRATLGSALPTAVAAVIGAIVYVATRWSWLYWCVALRTLTKSHANSSSQPVLCLHPTDTSARNAFFPIREPLVLSFLYDIL